MPSEALKNLLFGIKFKKKPTHQIKEFKKAKEDSKCTSKRTLESLCIEDEDEEMEEEHNEIEFVAPKPKKVKLPLTAEREAEIHKEKMNFLRNTKHIHVYGSDIPDPISSFQELYNSFNISDTLQRNITEMAFEEPTPVQMQAIPAVLHRREVMVCAPTGSGKTLAFGLPLLHLLQQHDDLGFRALILTPTHELALQTEGELTRLARDTGLKVRCVRQSTSAKQRRRWTRADIVITTPKKFVYCLKKYSPEINFNRVEWMVVDESDKLFEEGVLGFREQLGKIYKTCKVRKTSSSGTPSASSSRAPSAASSGAPASLSAVPLRTLLFSATFSSEVDRWCCSEFHSLLKVQVGAVNATTANIRQRLVYTGSEAGKLLALKNLLLEGFSSPALIFTQSKQRSEELVHELRAMKVAGGVEAIHSDKSLLQREAIVRSFSEGRLSLLISTELMCRGLDFRLVNLVINYDFPTTSVSYIHRIGRTGRAGREGEAVTFFTNDDVIYLRSIVNMMRQAGCEVPECMLKIKKPNKSIRKELWGKVMEREAITRDDLSDNKVVRSKMARKQQEKKNRLEKKEKMMKKKSGEGGVSGSGAGGRKRANGVGGDVGNGVKKDASGGGRKSEGGGGKVVHVVKDKKVKVIKMMVLNKKFKKKKKPKQ